MRRMKTEPDVPTAGTSAGTERVNHSESMGSVRTCSVSRTRYNLGEALQGCVSESLCQVSAGSFSSNLTVSTELDCRLETVWRQLHCSRSLHGQLPTYLRLLRCLSLSVSGHALKKETAERIY